MVTAIRGLHFFFFCSTGLCLNNTDCDDYDASLHPGQNDYCNGIDDNCNGDVDENATFTLWYADADSDGFGNPSTFLSTCDVPQGGYITDGTDCDDNNATINPITVETCNSIDDNCNNQVDEGLLSLYYADADSDGFGDPLSAVTTCDAPPSGFITDGTDCNDNNSGIHPNATETCNGIDDTL
jgi:hypothetical protein